MALTHHAILELCDAFLATIKPQNWTMSEELKVGILCIYQVSPC